LEIVDPSLVSFEVSGAVTVLKDYDLDAVKESVESALIEYFSPNNYPFSYDRIRLSQVISIISGIPGIYYVDSINLSSIGDGWLPQYGTDLLFLNKGTLPLLSLDDIDISFTMSEVM
jgi:hypothetical protein